MMTHRISARALAEFALASGDLNPAMQALSRMQEGAQAHRRRQSGYEGGFEREVSLSVTARLSGLTLTVYGRADGLNRQSDPPIIEEIKTTRLDPHAIDEAAYPVHWAQAELYAHMLAVEGGFARVEVRLTYMHLSGEARTYAHLMTSAQLSARFLSYAAPYADWLSRLDALKEAQLPTLKQLAFPYPDYRGGQREMAGQGYLAAKRRHNLLVQAPTGIGKTAAALFGALKAMGEGYAARIFYLTARTTARRAAEQTLDMMRKRGLSVRAITLTAKEKLCPFKDAACDPALCPRAMGYYDRRRDALYEALTLDTLSRSAVEALAEKHALCPFEMQLDLSESCDVIICDYNYAFDPRIKLKRFFVDKSDSTLLIDEAHNLVSRAREMLSAMVRESDFRNLARALAKLGAQEMRTPLYEALARVLDAFQGARAGCEGAVWEEGAPEDLVEKMEIFLDAARPLLGASALGKALTDRYFEALNLTRVAGEMNGRYRVLYEPEEKDIGIKLWCFDPSEYLRKCYAKARGAVLFSATLSPMRYYFDTLGLDEDAGDAMLDLPSPFPNENLCVVRVPIATTYRRREESAAQVAQAILVLARAKPGNYLACFPSHAYLHLVGGYLAAQAPDIRLMPQRPKMTEREREAFIRAFSEKQSGTMLALIAMGGVFAEGIDLPGEWLSGAAIVGVGIPQLSLERAALASLMGGEDEPEEGARFAYTYPGVERVLQTAGRVIRTETDRGAILLIDERFFSEDMEALFPPHWSVHDAKDAPQAGRIFDRFWKR
ncbi:MAG: ATP-dependent DNA helicase [Clostridia bacterium]